MAVWIDDAEGSVRLRNSAMFEGILVEADGSVVDARMTQPFDSFYDEEFRLPEGVGLGEPGAADRAAIRSVEGS